jgi:hypothetical protein
MNFYYPNPDGPILSYSIYALFLDTILNVKLMLMSNIFSIYYEIR